MTSNMTKVWVSTIGWDIRLQFRQGLYYAAAFVILVWWAVMSALPQAGVELFLPFAIFMDLSVFGFYFMAGMLYLERGERVLEALVVTPLPRHGYLVAKVTSLTLLAVLLSIVLVLLLHGPSFNWVVFVTGVALNSWLLTLVGFMLAARYDGINEFLIPSIVYMVPSQLPLLDYFGIWEHWLIYLVPTQPTMLLIEGAFRPIAGWQLVYAYGYLALAVVVVTIWAMRVYDRFVVRQESRSFRADAPSGRRR